jgi:tetratricopeptide (TPR) repeat protein
MNFEQKRQFGLGLIEKDDYREALTVFTELFQEDPHDKEVLAKCLFLFSRIIEGNYDFDPETPEQYIFRGVSKFYKSELEESIKDFEKALSLNSKLDYAHKCKAFSLRFMNRITEANSELRKAIELKAHGEYYDDMAENYAFLGDSVNAIKCHELAVNASPKDPRLWYNFGVHLGELKRIKEALDCFNKAIEFWPEYPDALHNKAVYEHRLRIVEGLN